jgi:hypothetical protein
MFTVRRVPAWRSATGGVAGDGRYTAFAFANPTRHVLGNLLMTRAGHVEVDREAHAEEAAESTFTGPDLPTGQPLPDAETDDGHHQAHLGAEPLAARHVIDAIGANEHHHTAYTTDVVELVETFLYRPLLRPLSWLVNTAKKLQSGRLDAYIGYMLIALIALIAVVVGFAG